MNFTTTSTIGIDTVIQSIQTELYASLISRWVDDIDGYGRVYVNKGDNGFIAQYYIAENDYKDVYYNDEKSGNFFFLTDKQSTTEDEYVYQNNTKIVFMLNLEKVVGSGRQDELVRRDVIELLRNISYNRFTINGIDTGVEDVFRGLNSDKVNKADINPLHTFSVNVSINYYLTDKCD